MARRFRGRRGEMARKGANDSKDKSLASLPEDILHLIVPYLTYLDRFRLKVAGSHSITAFISSLPRPPFHEYVSQLDTHTSKTNPKKADTEKALHNACAVGYEALVIKLISKYRNLRNYKQLESCLITAINSQQKTIVPVVLKYLPLGPFSAFLAGLRSSQRHFQGSSYVRNTVAAAALRHAAINNSAWAVQMLLKHGTPATSEDGLRGLYEAAGLGHEDVVAILSRRVRWKKHHHEVLVALLSAVENGHEGTVKILLRTGVEMPRRYHERGAIHLAAREGHEGILRLLLRKVPEDYYVFSGFPDDYSIKVYTKDTEWHSDDSPLLYSHYWSCLHFAIYGGHCEIVKFLLEREPGSLRDKGSLPPGYVASRVMALPLAAQQGDARIVNLLLYHGFDVSVNMDGKCALEIAAKNGHADVMALLLDAGIRLTVYHLMNAAASGSVPAVSLLLNRGADIHAKSHQIGNTPLHIAVKHHHPQIVHLFLQSGAETAATTNRYGETPLHVAIAENQKECFDLLLGCHTAAGASSGAAKKIHYAKRHVQSALVLAVERRRSHMIRQLLEQGADINSAADSKEGTTLFHKAAATGDVATLETVLASGAHRHARDARQRTALHYAAKEDHRGGAVVEKLLSWGLDADARDSKGQVPLHLVQHESEAYKSLISHGANAGAVDDNGATVAECQRLSYYTHYCA